MSEQEQEQEQPQEETPPEPGQEPAAPGDAETTEEEESDAADTEG